MEGEWRERWSQRHRGGLGLLRLKEQRIDLPGWDRGPVKRNNGK